MFIQEIPLDKLLQQRLGFSRYQFVILPAELGRSWYLKIDNVFHCFCIDYPTMQSFYEEFSEKCFPHEAACSCIHSTPTSGGNACSWGEGIRVNGNLNSCKTLFSCKIIFHDKYLKRLWIDYMKFMTRSSNYNFCNEPWYLIMFGFICEFYHLPI